MANLLESILKQDLSSVDLTQLADWPQALAEDYLGKGDSLKLLAEAVLTVAAQTAVPATAISAGKTGNIAFDASYFYICVATDTWRRVAILAW